MMISEKKMGNKELEQELKKQQKAAKYQAGRKRSSKRRRRRGGKHIEDDEENHNKDENLQFQGLLLDGRKGKNHQKQKVILNDCNDHCEMQLHRFYFDQNELIILYYIVQVEQVIYL